MMSPLQKQQAINPLAEDLEYYLSGRIVGGGGPPSEDLGVCGRACMRGCACACMWMPVSVNACAFACVCAHMRSVQECLLVCLQACAGLYVMKSSGSNDSPSLHSP